jgi:hypothetical protein
MALSLIAVHQRDPRPELPAPLDGAAIVRPGTDMQGAGHFGHELLEERAVACEPAGGEQNTGRALHARPNCKVRVFSDEAGCLHAVEHPDARMPRGCLAKHRVQLPAAFGRRGVQPRDGMTGRDDARQDMDRQPDLLRQKVNCIRRAARDRVKYRFVRRIAGLRPDIPCE